MIHNKYKSCILALLVGILGNCALGGPEVLNPSLQVHWPSQTTVPISFYGSIKAFDQRGLIFGKGYGDFVRLEKPRSFGIGGGWAYQCGDDTWIVGVQGDWQGKWLPSRLCVTGAAIADSGLSVNVYVPLRAHYSWGADINGYLSTKTMSDLLIGHTPPKWLNPAQVYGTLGIFQKHPWQMATGIQYLFFDRVNVSIGPKWEESDWKNWHLEIRIQLKISSQPLFGNTLSPNNARAMNQVLRLRINSTPFKIPPEVNATTQPEAVNTNPANRSPEQQTFEKLLTQTFHKTAARHDEIIKEVEAAKTAKTVSANAVKNAEEDVKAAKQAFKDAAELNKEKANPETTKQLEVATTALKAAKQTLKNANTKREALNASLKAAESKKARFLAGIQAIVNVLEDVASKTPPNNLVNLCMAPEWVGMDSRQNSQANSDEFFDYMNKNA